MRNKIFLIVLLCLFLISFTSAWNFESKEAIGNKYVNATYVNLTSTDTFIANYSTFLTHVPSSVLNNGSYLNVDTGIGNWSADKSSYTLLSVLNNGSYLNPEATDTFIANYSTFLTHITYDDVMNGTLKDYFDGLYIGIGTETEDKWNANYSTFLSNNESITNTFGLYTTLDILNNGSYLNVDTGIGNWTADKPNYTLLSVLNNGSYLNVAETDPVWTADKSSYTLLSVLNNGSYFNPEATDTFIANYSTFLTHITYDDVMNGTLKDYFDGLYIGIGTETESKWNANYSTFLLNNISITNALNTKLGISQWNATNTSYALLTELNNGSYLNVDTNIGNWTADKSSYTLLSVLNNGSYLNPEGTDTFIGNYSTFLTHITYGDVMNGTLKTYFDGFYPLITTLIDRLGNWSADKSDYYTSSQVDDVNTSMQNYVNTQNTSVKNYADSTMTAQNTSQTNYINAQNTSVTNALAGKLSLSGGTMTGNITLGNNYLTNGTAGGGIIYHNGTGWVIKG